MPRVESSSPLATFTVIRTKFAIWRQGSCGAIFDWFIEHHPEHEILDTSYSQLSPLPSAHFEDSDGYAEAKGLWLARIASDKASTAILSNAARFFEVPDTAMAQKLLLRLQSKEPDLRWSVRLAGVYALALAGAVDAAMIA